MTWVTVAELAAELGLSELRVASVVHHVGIADSKVHARGEGKARTYSPAAADIVRREIKSRSRDPKPAA